MELSNPINFKNSLKTSLFSLFNVHESIDRNLIIQSQNRLEGQQIIVRFILNFKI